MIDDHQVAETAQPVGEDDAARGDGVDFRTLAGADEQALLKAKIPARTVLVSSPVNNKEFGLA